IDLTQFEFEESPNGERTSLGNLESTLSRAENVFAAASSVVGDEALANGQQLPADAQAAESELRNVVARQVERAVNHDSPEETDANLSIAFARWTEITQALQVKNSRVGLVSQIVTEVQQLK